MESKEFHIHLVSDATGETINTIARACLVQFEGIEASQYFWSLIRTPRQLDMAIDGIRARPGLVMYTFVDEELRLKLEDFCKKESIRSISVLDPVMDAMRDHFGVKAAHNPGKQHVLDTDYFDRIEAMDFALALDDGNGSRNLEKADVIILGVSRTSKTPTCVYLANRGIKAANIPVVPGVALPENLTELCKGRLVVGLTKDPESLVEIRRHRLKWLNQHQETDYVDPDKVKEEVQEARRLFARLGLPVIDVSRRSIEETAAEVMMLLQKRRIAADSGREGQ
ncbi:MAG: pyruvate, phosphate dikinase/phosphoenolpyruvate synthase regulator [Alphaproteobacteria bacterium]|nr:pyruvate, phosphate dikinase/phosphoenolpyruvate synthase regulator [Alphaproteobacteria bacterium]